MHTLPRAIVFDVDDTLYRQNALLLRLAPEFVRYHLFRPREAYRVIRVSQAYDKALEHLREYWKKPRPDLDRLQLHYASLFSGIPIPEIEVVLQTGWFDRPVKHFAQAMMPYLESFLKRCQSHDIKLAVVSDYPAQYKLEAMGIASYFSAVVHARDERVGVLKPHPLGLQQVMEHLSVMPQDTWYIGDRTIDYETAQRAGARFIRFAGDSTSEEYATVRDYRELSNLLFG